MQMGAAREPRKRRSAMPIARPQNSTGVVGHSLYKGTAPIFVATQFQHIKRLQDAAAMDLETGLPGDADASMILRRMEVHRYTQRVEKPDRQLPYCARCFAKLIMESCAWNGMQ